MNSKETKTMYFLGVESSLRATKVIVVGLESSSIVASETVAHTFVAGLPNGHFEQDPNMWIRSLDQAVRSCIKQMGHRKSDIVAMSI
ncbi:hypothetical protein N9165_02845, partial [Akkermansiaceae bacterium]|nr:hypothetical protein [Akkermansiaceae bacterium]